VHDLFRMIIQGSVSSLSVSPSRASLWDPAIVRAVATEEEKFDEALRWSIQDAIRNILGESGLDAVRSILHLDELAKNPGEFHGQMDRIFGRGVLPVEAVVVKALFRRLNLHYVESGVFDFERYVNHAKKEFSGIWLRGMVPK
jgi:hypothetical protein